MESSEPTAAATDAAAEVLGGVKRSAEDAFEAGDGCALSLSLSPSLARSRALSLARSPSAGDIEMAASCPRPPSGRLTSGLRRCGTETGLPSRPA